ncbi:aromatic amino acid transaminase [Albimonas pacifica]|uniref:Aminotransferase n=1 Tax=Albimonas pacifica TaxID=1114924 RepID=A0A1I3BV17_9RHOB|nr:aromatic amino acid transaminase [Albimonas pacifica]SFH65926.1 aspartate aminotransferase/aromatic-amino-acid transaminase [Albimonas pacifica]
MFETLPKAEPDAILALMARFREDPRTDKIDLGVGVYRDETGATPIFRAVQAAEERLVAAQTTKTYVGLPGDLKFCRLLGEELLGRPLASESAMVQAAGGSGALYILAAFIRRAAPATRVWLPTPTWPNHPNLFRGAGLALGDYPWLDRAGRALDFAAAAEALEKLGPGDAVLLHACCHNPTGVDPTPEQWAEIGAIAARRGWLPVFDMAYAGFGDDWERDCAGMRTVIGRVPEALMAASCSKNFGLYRERAGAVYAHTAEPSRRQAAQDGLEAVTRMVYSMPPDHGGALVRAVLEDADLAADWRAELTAMRERINANRRALAEALAARPGGQGWGFIAEQRGIFSLLGLDRAQVDRLREVHGVYAVAGGRVNVAGMRIGDADRVAAALLDVAGSPAG